MNLTIRQLEILVAVGDSMSFTQAATQLGISQPAVSETIRRVEFELGLSLIDRTARKITLTREGRHIVSTAREAVRFLHHSFTNISNHLHGQRGHVTIAALPSAICGVLSTSLNAFLTEHSNVDVTIFDADQGEVMKMVENGIVDAGLVSQPDRIEGLEFQPILDDPLYLICSKEHPFASKSKLCWRDLEDSVFIALAPSSSVRQHTDAGFLQAGVSVEARYETRQIPTVSALASASLGVSVLPLLTLSMVNRENLATIPLIQPSIVRRIGFAYRRERLQPPSLIKFIQFVEDRVRALQNADP